MKSIAEKLGDETVRIERIILLAGAITDGAFSDDLNSFFDDEDEEAIVECLGEIPEYVDIEGHGYSRSDSICEWLYTAKKFGFLVQFATPVMEVTDVNSRTFSWGYYSTKWVYGETIRSVISKGMAWVKSQRRAEDRKAKTKKGGA